MDPSGSTSLFQRIGTSLASPFPNMTWTQVAAVTVFVLVVAMAWRQVTLFIGAEFD